MYFPSYSETQETIFKIIKGTLELPIKEIFPRRIIPNRTLEDEESKRFNFFSSLIALYAYKQKNPSTALLDSLIAEIPQTTTTNSLIPSLCHKLIEVSESLDSIEAFLKQEFPTWKILARDMNCARDFFSRYPINRPLL